MKNRKGFTLIEIIAVVIIIGIIALIVVPSVSSYIFNTRNSTYKAHEKTMEEAAKSLTIETINGKDNFLLPREGDHAEVFLSELVDKEYLDKLKDPSTGEECNEAMSYVIIKNVGSSSYDYKSCLYCGSYITEGDECAGVSHDDSAPPVCGIITGASTDWTKESRTITVSCSDAESGCTRNKFSRVFNTTTKVGQVKISDKSGKTTECDVNVYVDKTEPTCELKVDGDENIESTGWSSGRNVVVSYKPNSRKDEHSGIASYGIGTSLKNRNYNKLESYAIENLSGTTTVIGYVKDNAGNEGVCYRTVTTGIEKPVFDIRYGYQIYPSKERFVLSGATQVGDNQIKTTTTTPTITFIDMSKYQNVTAIIMDFNSVIEDPTSFKLTVGGNTYSAGVDNSSGSRLRFYIEAEPGLNTMSSKSDYVIKLGNKKDVTYTITRIELEQKDGNRVSRDKVAVNLITRKAVVKTTNWIWNDGNSWETQYYKQFDPTTGAKSGNARVKNDIPLTSDPVAYSIVEGDRTGPTISITSGNTSWTNQDITLTGKAKDSGTGIIAYMWSTSATVNYYDTGWQYYSNATNDEKTYTYTVTKNGTYYLHVKDEAGNVNKNSITITNIDKRVPTCSAISGQASLSCTDPAANNDYGQSKIVKYYWGTKSDPAVTDFKAVTATASFTKNETATLGNGTKYYVFVIDEAGNESSAASDLYYTVTYDKNGDGTITKTSDVRRKNTNADFSDTFKATKNGYTFKGWNTSATATTKLDSYKVTANATLYAVWAITNPTTVTLAGTTTKIYGASDVTITCTQGKTYAAGTTIYYSFGYSTTETGTPGNWTEASTTNTLTIGKTSYYGDRYYYCKAYAKNSYLTSGEVTSNKQLVRYNNAKITFDGNAGTVNGTNPVYVRTGSGTSYTGVRNNTTATNPTASRSCYTFNGWYTATSSGSKVLKNDGKLTGTAVTGYTSASAWVAIENKNLYAQWTAHTYSVAYDLDKGTYGTNHPTGATYDTAFTVNNPTKSVKVSFSLGSSGATASSTSDITKSYTFAGWKITDMDSVTHTYGSNTTTNTSISSTTATSFKNLLCNAGTVNFLALWTPPSITLPTITKTGYTCKWVSGTYEWASGGTYTPAATDGATSRTMTVSCSPKTYTITYKANGGTGSDQTQSVKYDATWKTKGAIYTKTGYVHDGWATSASGSLAYGLNSDQTAFKGTPTTLYAHWKPREFTISYYPNGGSGSVQTRTVSYNSNWTTEGAIFTKDGSTLDGWASTSSGGVDYSLNKAQGKFTGNSDLSLYAHWKTNTYTITYKANGGTGSDQTQTVKYGAKFTTKGKIFEREHYNLIGWYQRLKEYDYVDCLYNIYYGSTDNHHFNGYYSIKVDKAYTSEEARTYCNNNISTFKGTTDYARYVEWIEYEVGTTKTCKCSGNADPYEVSANDESSCKSRCMPKANGNFTKVCKCGSSESCSNKTSSQQSATVNNSACSEFCRRQGCPTSSIGKKCICSPYGSCRTTWTTPQDVESESYCITQCRKDGCNAVYEETEFDSDRVNVTLNHSYPSKRYEIKTFNLSAENTFTNTSNIVLLADWQEKASCPAGTTMVAGANTDNPTCCTNCTSVSNGTCSVAAGPSNTCKYDTSCNSGYTIVSGDGTNSPVCCPNCPSMSHGSCSVSWNGSKCVYTTSCNKGYRLSGNGTSSASCTRCEGWHLTNPNDDVFDTIDKIQGQKWEYLTTSDTKKEGWINVHGDIYTNQVTSDSNGNGVCDTGNSLGWFYISKKTKLLRIGWVCDNDKWYYLWNGMGTGDFRDYPSGELSGRLVVNVTNFDINGSKYSFNSDGVCTSGTGCDKPCSDFSSSYLLD